MGNTRMYQLLYGINVDNDDDKKEIEQKANQYEQRYRIFTRSSI